VTWCAPSFDLRSGLFVPRFVIWDPETGEFTRLGGPRGFATWEEAEEAGRFLRQLEQQVDSPVVVDDCRPWYSGFPRRIG